MPAKITTVISSRNFELIRDRIAQILTLELANQAILQNNSLFNATVWIERVIPFDKTDLPAINVYFNNNRFDNPTPITNVADNTYHIDVHVNAKHTAGGSVLDADKKAFLKCQKLIGVIHAILESPHYLRLDFTNGIIRHTQATGIELTQPTQNDDALHSVVGRLTFNVVANEIEQEIGAVEADKYLTQVKLDETEKGYYYETINT